MRKCMMVLYLKGRKNYLKALVCVFTLTSLHSNVELVGYPCAEEGCDFQGRMWTEYQAHRKAAHRGNLLHLRISCVVFSCFEFVISASLCRGSAVRQLCEGFP